MKKIIIVLIIGFAILGIVNSNPVLTESNEALVHGRDQQIADAYQNRVSDIQVGGSGVVIRILSDDTDGSRHQRFILRLPSGQTLLISHNIDLAPRINDLQEGDHLDFYGEYEWNPKGGVVHWTHHDPAGRHVDGWLKHNGSIYQ